LDRRLSEDQKRSGHCGAEKNLLHLPGIEIWLSRPQSIAISIELFKLPVNLYTFFNMIIIEQIQLSSTLGRFVRPLLALVVARVFSAP
jgi:hypothetical protein